MQLSVDLGSYKSSTSPHAEGSEVKCAAQKLDARLCSSQSDGVLC